MKSLLIFTTILFNLPCFGQIKPTVTQGHNFKLANINFSEDGPYAISFAGDNKLLLWDVNFRKEITELKGYEASPWGAALSGVDLSKSGDFALFANGVDLFIWELGEDFKNQPIKKQSTFKGCSAAMFLDEERICLLNERSVQIYNFKNDSIELKSEKFEGYYFLKHADLKSKRIVLTSAKYVQMYSTHSLELLRSFESPVLEPITVSLHPYKNQMIIAGNSHTAIECDFSGKKIAAYENESAPYLPICHYNSSEEIVGISHNKIYKWKGEDCEIFELPFQTIISAPQIKNGKLFIGNWNFSLGMVDFNALKYNSFEVSMTACEGMSSTQEGFIYKGRDGIVRTFDWGQILEPDFLNSKRDEEYPNVQTLGNLHTFHTTRKYLLTSNQNALILFNKDSKEEIQKWACDDIITSICGNEELAFDISTSLDRSVIYKTDLQNLKRSKLCEFEGERITHLRYSEETGLIAFSDGSYSGPSKILILNEKGKIKKTIEGDKSAISSVDLIPEMNSVLFSNGGTFPKSKIINLDNNTMSHEFDGRISAFNVKDSVVAKHEKSYYDKYYSIELKNISTNKTISLVDAHKGVISHLEFSDDGKYLLSASWDKSLKIWDWKDKELVLTAYFSNESEDFYLFNEEGYYFTSKDKVEDVYFESKGEIIPFQQYDLQLNRPDKILQSFPESDTTLINFFKRAREKRIERLGINDSNSPKPSDVPISRKIKIEVDEESQSFKMYNLENDAIVKLNGVEVNWRNLEKVKNVDEIIYKLNILSGSNQLELYSQNKLGIRSKTQYFQYENNETNNSNLYLITLAASEFSDNNFNLEYAAKDAEDIQKYFTTEWQSGEVKTLSLVNKKFIKNDLSKIKSFLSDSKLNDVVMVFISSHGVFDADLNYFIATHDMDFRKPAQNGLSLEFLEKQLLSCTANKKVVFIDACHSGEIDKSEVAESTEVVESNEDLSFRSFKSYQQTISKSSFLASKDLFVDLASTNGISYISSASGVEFAIEGDEWSNGVFTFALLDGLKHQKADLDNDKTITLSELEKYLFIQVPELTKGKQQPNSRLKNPYLDFIIQEKK